MPFDESVIHHLAVGDSVAVLEIVEQARTSDDLHTIVAAALFAPAPANLMARATALALTTMDRQLVAIAAAHLEGDADRVDLLARDHLADHPDSLLVAWINAASNPTPSAATRPAGTTSSPAPSPGTGPQATSQQPTGLAEATTKKVTP